MTWIPVFTGMTALGKMKTKNETKIDIGELLKKISSYNEEADLDMVKKAYRFAEECHKGRRRISGEEYISHPYGVALVLADLKVDVKTIAAGLLHDTIEDCGVKERDIEQGFGSEIAFLVSGVTKLGEINFDNINVGEKYKNDPKRIKKIESLRKLFLAMAEDIRVVIIKLADRYHNLQTLYALDEKDQKRIAEESMEIFAPLADRLGMGRLKADLEDEAFRYLYPKEYRNVKGVIKEALKEKEEYLSKIKKHIGKLLKSEGLEAEIEGRAKHLYSIYKKLKKKDNDISKIYDLMAVRIIVPTKSDCYKTLGIIHGEFKPLIYRIKDYIAVPKPNGYQSLHTTVFGLDGKITEIQIRTEKMHNEAEKGVAAHWHYAEMKRGKSSNENKVSFAPKDKMSWIGELLDWQEESDTMEEFVEGLTIDIFNDRIFVFSPLGDVFDLPVGATPIDFAFVIHSDIGEKMIGAKVNGKMVPIDYRLENRDIVEIITKKNAKGPTRDWLKKAVTNKAKNRIRAWVNKKNS